MTDTYRLSDRYTSDTGTVFMTGIQALARLPIEQLRVDRAAGLRTAAFASGYPGSPLGGLDGAFDAAIGQVPDLPFTHQPGVNEEYAASAVMGSQLACTRPDAVHDGVIGLWYGKAPGIDRAGDAIRHAVFAGTDPNGGAVALVGDDPLAKSSTVPSSSAGSLADKHIPVLYPASPAEALDLGRHAIALSRASGLWTGLKIVADVADGGGNVELDPNRVRPVVPTIDGMPYAHLPDATLVPPHVISLEREIYEVRYQLALDYAALNHLNMVTVDPPDAWIGLVSGGITYGEVREALRRLGLGSDADLAAAGVRLLKLQMPIPFNASTIGNFAKGLDEIVVLEEKHPNVESLVKDALYNQSHHPLVIGKFDERGDTVTPGHGSLTADDMIEPIRRRLSPRIGHLLAPARPEREQIPLSVARTPFFCSGCPHNRSTVVEPGTLVGAGIGCHTMVMLQGGERFGEIAGLTCMGNEGTQWIGMAPFISGGHMVQNIGDGTYFHSGRLAVAAAVAAGVNITYKLLWNGAVAMTGGQDPTGRLPLGSVASVLTAQGVKRVLISTDDVDRTLAEDIPYGVEVWHRDRLGEAQAALAAIEGVTVLIHDQRCAAELRRDRKRGRLAEPPIRVVINERVCEGCGDCASISNCLSVQPVETPFGRKTRIDQDSCNLDLSCIEGDCPAFATVTKRTGRRGRRARLRAGSDRRVESSGSRPPEPPEPPEPPTADHAEVNVHITGVGGTGVVTVSQILGTAAMLDGIEATSLDQIGLSQKAGPVVSDLRLRRAAPPDSSRVGSGRDGPRRVGSGRIGSGRIGSGRIESGRIDSGRIESSRVGAGQADLLLAFDLLVAASWTGLSAADPQRTAVVGSTALTPPGAKIAEPGRQMPEIAELLARIEAATVTSRRHWADAASLCESLVGDSVAANVFVVGMAVQAGLLPISPGSIAEAIRLNGVAVERNLAAFGWGRAQLADPEAVEAAAARHSAEPEATAPLGLAGEIEELAEHPGRLRDTLTLLSAELTAFQDIGLAKRFLADLAPIRLAELAVDPTSDRLTVAAARGLHKLCAYKDEYEVARLLLLDDAALAEVAGPGDKVAWRLHPPTLRALGRRAKMSFGVRWGRPLMRLLAAGKRLRGTPLDPFGRAEVRRVERALIDEYRNALAEAAAGLSPETFERAVDIAGTPELVRGYENVKLRSVERFRERLAELCGLPEPVGPPA